MVSEADPQADLHADLYARFKAARERTERQPGVSPDMITLARDAQAAGAWVLAVDILCLMAETQIRLGEPVRAVSAIDRAVAMALKRTHPAQVGQCLLLRASAQQESGEHATALRTVVELAKSRHGQAMPARLRGYLYATLAELAAAVDPGDGVRLALSIGRHQFTQAGEDPPPLFLSVACAYGIDQAIWSSPPFATLLRPLVATESERQAWLLDAERDGLAAVGRWEPSEGQIPGIVEPIHRLVIQALRDPSQGRPRLAQAWRCLSDAGIHNRHFQIDTGYQVAGAAMVLGDAVLADEIITATGPGREGTSPFRWQLWLHLCSLVHHARGRTEQALADYQAYATDWSTSAQRMNLHVRDVISTLASMPGGRPADLSSQPPGYFRRALQFIDNAAAQPLSLAGIANAVGVSERTLRQCFQVYTGKSPKQFSLDRRLDQVHAMLTSGQAAGMTLADLARRMGFTNPTRFSRLYKARFGQPPQALRSH